MRAFRLAALALAAAVLALPAPVPAAAARCPASPQELVDGGWVDEVTPGPSRALATFDHESGRGCVLTRIGGRTVVRDLPGAGGPALAFGPGGGRAYLARDGWVVRVHGPVEARADSAAREIELREQAGFLAWLDDRRLAVAPTNGPHRVEVLDAETGRPLMTIGEAEPIPTTPGYRVLRGTAMAWDGARNRLHTLDTYTGSYRAYVLPGEAARRVAEAQVEDRHRARYEETNARLDRELSARGEFQGALFERFSLALDASGTAWIVERCDRPEAEAGAGAGAEAEAERGGVAVARLLEIDAEGRTRRHAIDAPCCSLTAVPWGDDLVLVANRTPAGPGCFATLPLPARPGAAPAPWMEVTPLTPPSAERAGSFQLRPFVVRPASAAAIASRLEAIGGPSLALVCVGGAARAVDCRQLWLNPAEVAADELVPEPVGGRRVVGRVTLASRGVAGATIGVVPEELRSTRPLTLPLDLPAGRESPVREIVTGPRGGFELPALAPGAYRLLVTLPGGRLDRATTFTIAGGGAGWQGEAPPRLDLGAIDFPEGVPLEVVVTGADGQPVPGAEAGAAQPLADRSGGLGTAQGVALYRRSVGEDGRVLLDGLVPGERVVVTCFAPGHLPWRESFDVPPASVSCVLLPLATLAGRVVDSEGEPVAEASVELVDERYGGGLTAFTGTSDADGRFRLEDLDPGAYRLTVVKPGFSVESREIALEAADEEEVGELVLDPAARWRHRVVARIAGSDDEPVPDAEISVASPAGSMRPATTDAWGEVEVEGPAAGRLALEVRAEGFAPRIVAVPESARSLDREPSEIVLEPAGWIVARVWSEATGRPCAGCEVALSGPGPASRLVTDASGAARSGPLAPGSWRASRTRLQSDGALVTRSGGDDLRTARVAAGEVTEIRFGEPAETVEVLLSPPPLPPDSGGWSLTVRDGGAARTYPLDASGSARIERPTGTARLTLLGARASVEIGSLTEDATDPTVVDLRGGALTLRSSPEPSGRTQRLALIDLATGRPAAEIVLEPGTEVRVPYLAAGPYALRTGDTIAAAVTVFEGQETVWTDHELRD